MTIYCKSGAVAAAVAAVQTDVDTIAALVASTPPDAVARQVGRTQYRTVTVTSAANASDLTLGTATSGAVLILSVTVHADSASQTDLTSIAVKCGAAGANTIIDAASTGLKANIDAAGECIWGEGKWRLASGGTVIMDFTGSGATAVALTVDIEYVALVAGAYLA